VNTKSAKCGFVPENRTGLPRELRIRQPCAQGREKTKPKEGQKRKKKDKRGGRSRGSKKKFLPITNPSVLPHRAHEEKDAREGLSLRGKTGPLRPKDKMQLA